MTKIDTQMLKGVLTGSLLSLLAQEELYGYALSSQLADIGFTKISKGTIYPLLLSLEKKELITSTLRPSESGPPRKYYRLTEAGLLAQHQFTTQWQTVRDAVDRLLEQENINDANNSTR